MHNCYNGDVEAKNVELLPREIIEQAKMITQNLPYILKKSKEEAKRQMPLDRRKFGLNPKLIFALLYFSSLFCAPLAVPNSFPVVSCPTPCTCSYRERLVNCSNRSLRKIPVIPPWVAILSLKNNKIGASAVKDHTFRNLPNLQELDISDNDLRVLNISFHGSPLLHTLRLESCSLESIPYIDPTGRPNVTSLALSHNAITRIEGLSLWPALLILNLSFNSIRRIHSNTFVKQSNLTQLYLHKNNISSVDEHAFAGLLSLETLSLGRNKIGIGRHGLKHFAPSAVLASEQQGDPCNGNLRKLRFLDLSRNRISRIEPLTFNGMCQLHTLLLHDNRISRLLDASFYSLKALTTLRMDDNRIRSVIMGWLYDLKSLQTLSLSRNKVSSISAGAWELCKEIRYLNLSHNYLSTIVHSQFQSLNALESLDLSRNSIVVLEDNAFYGLTQLRKLVLSRNRISSSVEDLHGAFHDLRSIDIILLNNNRIRSLSPATFAGAESVTYLDLRNNNITSIQNRSFEALTKLTRLRINSASFLCDCQLTWYSMWLKEANISITSEEHSRCFHPPKLHGRRVANVRISEFECGEHPIPALLQQPSRLTSYKGENVTLECSASATLTNNASNDRSSIEMSVVWRRGRAKTVIPPSRKVRIRNQQRLEGGHIFFTSFLILYDVTYDNDDEYSCVISNEFGHAKSTPPAHLSVFVYPTITKQPEDRTVKCGSEVIFQCRASGHPVPDISWQKDGGSTFPAAQERRLVREQLKNDLDEAGIAVAEEDDDFTEDGVLGDIGIVAGSLPTGRLPPAPGRRNEDLFEDAPLHISDVKPKDAGVYTCTAKSKAGVHSVSATLTVLYPPIVEMMPKVIEAVQGGNAVLKCMASANPSPLVTWSLNGGVLNGTARHFLAADDQLLVIVNFSSADEGEYKCSVTNILGVQHSSTKLVLVQHLNNESERKGLWEDFFGANGIVVLAVFVCVLATSLVWLIVLCYTRSKHDGALSTNTESTEFQPVDSSSHGSLEKPTLHRHLQSRSDLMSTPIRHNCQSFPRNYVEQTMGNTLNPGSPSDRHFCDRIHQNRTLQQHPVRALSTSHMHNTRIESAHVHRSTQCLSSPVGPRCASNPHKRPPNQAKRRPLRRRQDISSDRETPNSSTDSGPGSDSVPAVAKQLVVVSSARVVETSSLMRSPPEQEEEPLLSHPNKELKPPTSSNSFFQASDT